MAGYNAIHEVAQASFDAGVEYVSAYVFSTENWKRSADEVSRLMGLVLRLLTTDISIMEKNDIRVLVAGSREGLHKNILKAINDAEERTKNNTSGTILLCVNYGGQQEIVDAVKKIIQSDGTAEITPELIEKNLYAPEVPPMDLVVRTSGENRLSNYLLWRAAYSEFLFLEKDWPDMTKEDLPGILEEYSRRGRRFGG
jgi:undecaprenyl diphosphate synthase